ncbi:MAG: VCBS repeat-containing protein [Reichenbachiella sp.]|uniref:VCBS repeat-containing protein n=1 Tax=Reichenbachiella sp. TaxID=2184521 RepID=UPI0032979402
MEVSKTKEFNTGLIIYLILLIFGSILSACQSPSADEQPSLFSSIDATSSGINFQNKIIENQEFNYYKYIYAYNGGGVASADFNNDGLQDLFFVSNLNENKLYLNKGNLTFEDVSNSAGISNDPGFDTGVTTVDINQDGFLDVYICRAGWYKEDSIFANQLFINNGNLTFSERAKDYGLAAKNRSQMSTFFDYDGDGDLDVYIVNAPELTKDYRKILNLDSIRLNPMTESLKGSDKLYRNDNGQFVDVSRAAGILPERAFGLNAQVGDLNGDGWLDIYVSNDFEMPDFVFINKGDGTFEDQREKILKHMSYYSMGSDVADINNDGLNDIIVLDMNPEDYIRSKTTMAMTSVRKFQEMVDKNYHYQYMHNVLQLNNGNSTFSEIAQMSGIANTDWSWAPLAADYDLDGYIDLYVTNGIYRDVVDQDANKKIVSRVRSKNRKPTPLEYLEYAKMLPQQKMKNYLFKNNGDLTFSNMSSEWSNMTPSFSNGAVYTDLDNDGDLDIAINNINQEATILKNNAVELKKGNFLQIDLIGPDGNRNGLGAQITISFVDGSKQTREHISARGYLSSMNNSIHFGLGEYKSVSKLEVRWPNGHYQVIEEIKANQKIKIDFGNAIQVKSNEERESKYLFQEEPFGFSHFDTVFDDYQIQLLLPHKLSQLGPAIAKTDINNDGFDDLYLGGGYLQSGRLLLGNRVGAFVEVKIESFLEDRRHEDIGAVFFDADHDGDQDLYVVSGSYEFQKNSSLLQDRLYLNDKGSFIKCEDCLPQMRSAGSVVAAADFDGDQDIDLFVGGRLVPGKYPYTPDSYLLSNELGKFKNVTSNTIGLANVGMVTDAQWSDIDGDHDIDLIVTGEWMGIEVFENVEGQLIKSNKHKKLSSSVGWWNEILITDVDNDGDQDVIAGNLGLNYKYHASSEKPFHIYTHDFDANGIEDILLAKNYKGQQVPVRGKNCTAQQLPYLGTKINSYQEFAQNDLQGIIGSDISMAFHMEVNEFRSGIFYNEGSSEFSFVPFALEAQMSPVNSILAEDFDGDQQLDLILAGNNYMSEIETTRADAGIGSFLKGNGEGFFEYVPNTITQLYADKDVRDMLVMHTSTGKKIVIANNDDQYTAYSISQFE